MGLNMLSFRTLVPQARAMMVAATTDTMRVFLWVMGCSAIAMAARGSDEGWKMSPGDHVKHTQEKKRGKVCDYVQ
jgi:hypothetical protein